MQGALPKLPRCDQPLRSNLQCIWAWRSCSASFRQDRTSSMGDVQHQRSHSRRSAYFPDSAKSGVPLSENSSDAGSHSQPQHRASSPDQQHILRSSSVSRPAVVHRATFGQSSGAVRAWRFPSSRRFLWDRTATGPCIHLHPQATIVHAHTHPSDRVLHQYLLACRALHRFSCQLSWCDSKPLFHCKNNMRAQESCIYQLSGKLTQDLW